MLCRLGTIFSGRLYHDDIIIERKFRGASPSWILQMALGMRDRMKKKISVSHLRIRVQTRKKQGKICRWNAENLANSPPGVPSSETTTTSPSSNPSPNSSSLPLFAFSNSAELDSGLDAILSTTRSCGEMVSKPRHCRRGA